MSVEEETVPQGLEDLPDEAKAYVERLIEEVTELRTFVSEKERLLTSIGELHAQCLEFHHSEAQLHNELGRLSVSASQLSSSISTDDVVAAIREIVANLIGSEELAILSVDPQAGTNSEPENLSLWGVEPDWRSTRESSREVVDEVLRTGVSHYMQDSGELDFGDPAESTLTACVALRAGDRVVGAIVIFGLLPQKQNFSKEDQQLCEMVSTLAGQALYCSELHARISSDGE